MRVRRTPFYGDAEDAALLGAEDPVKGAAEPSGKAHTLPPEAIPSAAPAVHPNYREIGAEVPLGFLPHQGENRKQRLAGVANFASPEFSRRTGVEQRQRQRRGKLDPELRRLQRRKLNDRTR